MFGIFFSQTMIPLFKGASAILSMIIPKMVHYQALVGKQAQQEGLSEVKRPRWEQPTFYYLQTSIVVCTVSSLKGPKTPHIIIEILLVKHLIRTITEWTIKQSRYFKRWFKRERVHGNINDKEAVVCWAKTILGNHKLYFMSMSQIITPKLFHITNFQLLLFLIFQWFSNASIGKCYPLNCWE